MARGFWKGLLHGGALGVVALAALSLAAPLPEPPQPYVDLSEPPAPESQPEPQSQPEAVPDAPAEVAVVTPVPVTVPKEPAPAPVAQPPAPEANTGPDATTVDLPVGSEFGRADVAPVLPGPLTVPEGRSVSDAPAVSAPAAEPSPVAVTAADPRPDAQVGTNNGPDRPQPAEGEVAPTLDLPAMQAAPDIASLPGMDAAGQADLSPLLPAMAQEPAPQAPVEQAPVVMPARPDGGPDGASAPDLTLPPSLSDLGGASDE